MSSTVVVRPPDLTLDQVEAKFQTWVENVLKLEVEDAKFENRVAAQKANHGEKTAGLRVATEQLQGELVDWILSHPGQFVDPRKIVTDFGAFGLQSVTGVVEVTDEQQILDWLAEQPEPPQLLVTTVRLDQQALKRLLQEGVTVPGARLVDRENVHLKPDAALRKQRLADATA